MYIISARVGASRTDRNGRLKFASALDLIQDCSMHWMESEPAFAEYLAWHGLMMVLISRQVDVVRLPVYGENVTVRTSIFESGSFLGNRNTVLYDEDGAPCVLTWSVGAFIDRNTGKLARLPSEVVSSITLDDKVPMDYLDKKIILPDILARQSTPLPVRRGDIDLNGHMNNARYVEAALELMPEGFSFNRLRVEYRAAAKYGDMLHPRLIDGSDGKWYVALSDMVGRPYALMEFS